MPCAGWTVIGASIQAVAYTETGMPSTWTIEQVYEWLRKVDEGKETNLVEQFVDDDIDGAALIFLGPHCPPRGAQAVSSCRRGSLQEAAAALRPCEGRRGKYGDDCGPWRRQTASGVDQIRLCVVL